MVGLLQFDYYWGGCNTFSSENDENAWLCFAHSVIIFGGYKDEYVGNDKNAWVSSKIAKFVGDKWLDMGEMQNPRSALSVIKLNDKIFIIGGYGFRSQET